MPNNSNTSLIEKRALIPREVSFMYGFSEGSLANMRCKRIGPKYFKVGRKVIYFQADLDAWARACPVQTIDSVEA